MQEAAGGFTPAVPARSGRTTSMKTNPVHRTLLLPVALGLALLLPGVTAAKDKPQKAKS